MNECAKCRDLMAEALYGELTPEDEASFEAHLGSVRACASEFKAMTKTLKILERRERRDPGPEFWEGYWDRLGEAPGRESARGRRRSAPADAAGIFALFPAWACRAPRPPPSSSSASSSEGPSSAPAPRSSRPSSHGPRHGAPGVEQASTPVLRAQDYFERSKLILLGLVNYDPGIQDAYGLDLPRQKQLSRELVNEAGSLKNDLKAPAQKRLRELVADLETILVQIANLESANDFEAVEFVKQGVGKQGHLPEDQPDRNGASPKEGPRPNKPSMI